MKRNLTWRAALLVALCAFAVTLAATRMRARSISDAGAHETNEPQDLVSLDRRVSFLEQRLVTVETSLRNVEQQVAFAQRAAPSTAERTMDARLLQQEIDALQIRVRELQCGLGKLDERTLPANLKQSQTRAPARPLDPCRANPDAPLSVQPRP